jgi:hypothetical protein
MDDSATAISAALAAPSIETGLLRQAPLKIPDRHFHVLHRGRALAWQGDGRLLEMIAGPWRAYALSARAAPLSRSGNAAAVPRPPPDSFN